LKIVQINATCGAGSTGKICVSVSDLLTAQGVENYILYASGHSDHPQGICYTNKYEIKWNALKSRVFGNYGFNSKGMTKRLIKELDRISPEIVHLHNLHGHNCHLEMLLRYLREHHIKVYWTFHDCWAFTGYCPHFVMNKCDKWKTGCFACPQARFFSWFFDKSKKLHNRKKQLAQDLDLTIVTPSHWLAELVGESFLKDYPVKVIHNGIDLTVFKPTESDFRKKHGCEGKFVLLGVAFGWGARKGLDVFVELASRLDDRFQIVLVGTDDAVDRNLPEGIISIHRTQNQAELAEIYTAADLFVNPTREDTYPTVNMESLACGTPVVTFQTGGSPECIDPACGSVVPCDDIDALEQEILRIAETKPYSLDACLNKAKEFDMNQRFEEYVKLYTEVQK